MRILLLNYEFPPLGGGASPQSYQLARALVAMGHQVDVVTARFRDLPRKESIEGINVTRVSCLRARPDICRTHEMVSFVLKAIPVVRRMLRDNAYDVIHSHFLFPTTVILYSLRRHIEAPIVVTAHGSDVPGYNPDRFKLAHKLLFPFWKRIARMPDVITTPSNYLKHLMIQQLNADPGNIVRIPNGIFPERFRTDRSRQKRILAVTRLFPRKGIQFLLRALQGLPLDWAVAIVGDGTNRDELEALAAVVNMPVRFYGWIDNQSQELRDLYETSSIFVFPSLVENFPTVLLEAMSAGLAVITTAETGCAEVIGEAGITVPPGDVQSLREAILYLTENPADMRQLGRTGRRRIEENFTWPSVAQEFTDMFRSLIDQWHVAD